VLTAVALGFLLGLRHASDPDHVVAVSAMLSSHRRPWVAACLGAAWGAGHSLTILAAGGLIVLLRLSVPERAVLGFELGVGLVLIALGVANLALAGTRHPHGPQTAAAADGARSLRRPLLRASAVGLVHGLAGSAAVALLALAAMPSPAAALAYLAVFCVGTVAGMVAVSVGIGVPFGWAGRIPGAQRWIVAGSGAASLAFGAWLVYDIGFGGALLR